MLVVFQRNVADDAARKSSRDPQSVLQVAAAQVAGGDRLLPLAISELHSMSLPTFYVNLPGPRLTQSSWHSKSCG